MTHMLFSSFPLPLVCVAAIGMLFPGLATAQLAPTSLAVPSTVTWSGTYLDSFDGTVFETKGATIISGTAFTAPQITGTYTYTKNGANTGSLVYISNYSAFGETETENGTVNLTFTSSTGGTFTSSGTYTGTDIDGPYSGSFTDGSGTFTYSPVAPDLVFVSKRATYQQTSVSAPTLLNYGYHSALEGLAAPYATAPTLSLPAGASPSSRTYTYNNLDQRYEFEIAYVNGGTTAKQQLDAAFPNGNHTIQIAPNSLTLTLTADSYPTIPTISTTAGSWINGQLVLTTAEAAAGFTITGSSTSANGFRSIEIYDDNDTVDFFEWDNGNGTAPPGPVSRNIPGGLLKVGGPYYCEVEYDQVVDSDTTKISQFGTGFAMFSTNTAIEIVVTQKPRDLVGTWTITTEGGGKAYITFLDNGTYHHVESGTDDPNGYDGLEVGTYTWNTATGALSTTPTEDQNGQWGLSHNAPDIKLFVNGGQLELVESGEVAILDRPASSAAAIVGTWVIISEGRSAVITFLADGTYRHSEVGSPAGGGFSGMEAGTYVWNSITGALTANPILDQNGEWGLSHPLSPFVISASGDQLTIMEGSLRFGGQRADATTALSAYLGDASIPYNQRGPLDDPDGNGISNLMGYALGLAPNSASVSGLPTGASAFNPATGKNHLVLTMTLNANATGIVLTPEVTSNLSSAWNSGSSHIQTVSDTVSNGVRTWVVRDLTPIGSGSGIRFLRLSVSQP